MLSENSLTAEELEQLKDMVKSNEVRCLNAYRHECFGRMLIVLTIILEKLPEIISQRDLS